MNVVSEAFFLVTCTLRVRCLYEKRGHIKLMKLTAGINFINILCTNFSYERHFSSFFSSYMYVTCSMFVRKTRAYKVDEIDGRYQFHQHVLSRFFLYENVFQSFSLIKIWLCNLMAKEYWRKSCL